MRYEVKGELGNLTIVIASRNLGLSMLGAFPRLRHDAPKERWRGTFGKVGPSKSQTHFVAEGKVRKVQSLKGFNTFKKHKTSISCSCPTDNSHCCNLGQVGVFRM